MVSKIKKILLGVLSIVIAATVVTITFLSAGLQMKVEATQTNFYVWENNHWVISGTEHNKILNGTKIVSRDTSKMIIINTSINGSMATVSRYTFYKNGLTLIDRYLYNGSLNDINRFPVSHIIEIKNGNLLTFEYSVDNIVYNGITRNA